MIALNSFFFPLLFLYKFVKFNNLLLYIFNIQFFFNDSSKIKKLKSLKKYIYETKIISGKKTGGSDITLYNDKQDKYIFITSKFF